MRIEISALTSKLTPGVRDWMVRRVEFVLGRFADRLRRVRVTLSDVNGPRGGLDKECRVTAQPAGGESIIVEVLDSDFAAAFSRAVKRISRQLSTGWERRRERRRRVNPRRGAPAESAP